MHLLMYLLISQTPVLIESFSGPQFPPQGWDTLKSGANMTTWYRYTYTFPDSSHARQRVYDAADTLRTGWSILLTPGLDLTAYNGPESLFFWYRFSLANNNMGPDDTLYIEISNDQVSWLNLMKIDISSDTNVWIIPRINLASHDTFATARIR
ncbi:MAG: hypothetical protein ABIL20_04940, partial [candidate division WOR-3 bacterium]